MSEQLILVAQAIPRLDGTYWIMLTSRILHILGAIILVGGLFYLRNVVIPLPDREVPGEGSSSEADRLFGGRRAAWAKWVGIATALLLITGFWNYFQFIKMNEKFAPSYHMIAGMKMLAGLVLFFLAALVAGRTSLAERLRTNMRFWLNVCLIIGILTVALGAVLKSYPHIPKIQASDAPVLIAP